MSVGRLVIRELILKADDAPDARVSFTRGLNVISGPSDTGKTFIAECIDFMLGASDPPERIPEAARYVSLSLLIEADGGVLYEIERALRGGNFRVREIGLDDSQVFAAKHVDGSQSLSSFLLGLIGLSGRRIRLNQQGKTRSLSFRDINKLVLVDEESIIAKGSPIVSGQYVTMTAEKNVFRLLLTGQDDSAVIPVLEDKVNKNRVAGRTEVIELLRDRARRDLRRLVGEEDTAVLRERLDEEEQVLDNAANSLRSEQAGASELEVRRRQLWIDVRQAESKAEVLQQLQVRFALLDQQYEADVGRLELIAEAGANLGQMGEERCPICGALKEHHDIEHLRAQTDPTLVSAACVAEANKIRILRADLARTMLDNGKEIQNLHAAQEDGQTALERTEQTLRDEMKPRIAGALERYQAVLGRVESLRRAVMAVDRIDELETLLAEVPKKISGGQFDTAIRVDEVSAFCEEVEGLLRAWRFPGLSRVEFSEKNQDIVISGRPRGARGKGVRAVTHAAFNIALLRYCLNRSMPHPGFVLVDSPLVVYREPDVGEGEFPTAVKDAFYRDLAASFGDAQIIIMENLDPPSELLENANLIRFTGSGVGRSGFVPV